MTLNHQGKGGPTIVSAQLPSHDSAHNHPHPELEGLGHGFEQVKI